MKSLPNSGKRIALVIEPLFTCSLGGVIEMFPPPFLGPQKNA